LPAEVKPVRVKNKKEQFLERLPEEFIHQDFIDLAKSLDIPERTTGRYIMAFVTNG